MPRRAVDGGELPSPRVVSLTVVRDVEAPSETDSIFVMQFGQVIDHADGSPVPCCTEDGQFLSEQDYAHGKCFPIVIPKDDPFYSKFNRRCMEFARSAPACRNDRKFGYANINTHFLDLSPVYGSDDEVASDLRTFQKGSLKATPGPKKGYYYEKDLMPADNETTLDCDNRVNDAPYMAVTQTSLFRQHNRLAEELAALNPHWGDERLYQESRRIVVAQWQHIVYNEYLPVLIGRKKMQELGIFPLQRGFSHDYDDKVNPSILNEFTVTAFRFGHSLVQGNLVNEQREKEKSFLLRHLFFKMQEVYVPGNVDKFLIAQATLPGETVDNYFTVELTNHLFEEAGTGFGMDLVSLDTQRGRDHGLRGYNSYRAVCGIPRAKDFDDLLDLIPANVVESFKSIYASVDDIDLLIAAVSEKKAEGAAVGPTYACIIGEQFLRLKRGDRYFYDLGGQAGSFTEEQLDEIRKTSYSRIVCDNSDIRYLQPLVFKLISDLNPLVNCESTDSIPRMSLQPWKEVEITARLKY
ncbi:hypothetical protein DAPPUDRAFT_304119 [Daphnia pulex]|uniref:Peroxinectin n=1 Tax=Daphnia pulex TaxID=6669 RepID=E9GJC8_DAPPU|nr:hypothetical protein DAPPUDRAFT_304119 [Daphnia pulex]|eukprot:EFX80428.1 hypothetical protein DAPPUDRAFT_304119 [Daphnia pulex]